MRVLILLLVLATASASLWSQATTALAKDEPSPDAPGTDTPLSILAGLSGGLLPSSVSLSGLPGIASCCPEYTSASGWIAGLTVGVGYAVSKTVSLEGGLGFHLMRPSTSADEVVPMNAQFQTVDGTISHEISIDALTLEIRTGVSAALAPGLRVMVAPSILLPLSATFTQTEELVEPETVEFVDGKKTWNNTDGPLTVDPVVSLGAGARYTFAIANAIALGPEVWYHFAFTDMVPDWRVNRLTLGVNVTYSGSQ